MAHTIMDVLKNAEYNLNNNNPFSIMVGREQLSNAVRLLEEGYNLDDEFEQELIDTEDTQP